MTPHLNVNSVLPLLDHEDAIVFEIVSKVLFPRGNSTKKELLLKKFEVYKLKIPYQFTSLFFHDFFGTDVKANKCLFQFPHRHVMLTSRERSGKDRPCLPIHSNQWKDCR